MSKHTPIGATFADWLEEYGAGSLNDRLTAALAEIEHGDLHDVARTLLEGCLELLDKASPQPTRGWLL